MKGKEYTFRLTPTQARVITRWKEELDTLKSNNNFFNPGIDTVHYSQYFPSPAEDYLEEASQQLTEVILKFMTIESMFNISTMPLQSDLLCFYRACLSLYINYSRLKPFKTPEP